MFNFRKKENKENTLADASSDLTKSMFKEESIRSRVAAEGINPNPLGYMVISDKGKDIFIRNFYIDKLPRRVDFVNTFASIFNFSNSTSSVFIEPMLEGKAIKHLDKRVLELDTEVRAALKGDRNRARKMQGKLEKTEAWAANIESGANKLYEIGFLFSLYAESLDKLGLLSSDFISLAREKGIEMVATYATHPEAYLSNGPFTKIYNSEYGLLHVPSIKRHPMDRYGLSTIFSHTTSHFNHENGVPLGRNMKTKAPVLYDPYDKSHNGYGLIFAGTTGTGKSATIKILSSRLVPFKFRVVIIDSDKRGNRGEYSMPADKQGGINFQIKTNSKNIINIFEIDVQEEYDEVTDTEFKTLRLLDKIADVTNIIKTMIVGTKSIPDFNLDTYITRIVTDIVTELYRDCNIFDGDIHSLFERDSIVVSGKLTTGERKKILPTVSDFYLKALKKQTVDTDIFHKEAYTIIIDVMKDYVKDLYYNKKTYEKYSKVNYQTMKDTNHPDIENIVHLVGTKGYYDGQSTVFINKTTPVTNIDISDLPKEDIPVAQTISLNFVNENFIKKNSENPKKAEKLIVVIDECHRMFPYPDARRFLSDIYRTARKRNISPWTATQALKDFDGYPEIESILTNTTSIFLFKQSQQHSSYLQKNTILTSSQIEEVISLGGDPSDTNSKERKGEVCIIDNDKVAFVKVDYLFETEKYIVETDMKKLEQIYS